VVVVGAGGGGDHGPEAETGVDEEEDEEEAGDGAEDYAGYDAGVQGGVEAAVVGGDYDGCALLAGGEDGRRQFGVGGGRLV